MPEILLAIPILGTIWMICKACGKFARHDIIPQSKKKEMWKCSECNVGQTYLRPKKGK